MHVAVDIESRLLLNKCITISRGLWYYGYGYGHVIEYNYVIREKYSNFFPTTNTRAQKVIQSNNNKMYNNDSSHIERAT